MGRRLGLGRIRFCKRLRLGRLGGSCAHRLVRRHRSHRDALGCRWHFQLLLRLWQARPEWSGWSEWKAMRVCCGVEWGPHRGTPIVEWLLATWVADAVHGPTRSVTKPQLTMSATPCERYAATLAGQYCQLSPVSIKTNSHVSQNINSLNEPVWDCTGSGQVGRATRLLSRSRMLCNVAESRGDADRRRAPRCPGRIPHARRRHSRARLSQRRPRTYVLLTG